MLDRLPRLTADHSVGAPISRDDLWWLIAQVYQLRSELAPAEIMAGSMADDATQCTSSIELDDGPSRCQYSVGHPGPHSYEETARCTAYRDDPWFSRCVFDADHTGTHSYEHQRKQAARSDAIRLCGDARTDSGRCQRLRGHEGPCKPQAFDGSHEDTYQ